MGKFQSSNNLNMTRKALKKTSRQSPDTRRSPGDHIAKKKNPRGLQKTNPPGGEQTPQGTIITSFQAPSLLGRVLMVFAWNWAAKLIRTDFLCRAAAIGYPKPNLKLSVNNSPISRRANEKEGRSLWKALRLGAFCEPLFCQCANSLTRTPQVSKNRRGPCSHRPLFPNPPHAGRHQSRSRPSAENDL